MQCVLAALCHISHPGTRSGSALREVRWQWGVLISKVLCPEGRGKRKFCPSLVTLALHPPHDVIDHAIYAIT